MNCYNSSITCKTVNKCKEKKLKEKELPLLDPIFCLFVYSKHLYGCSSFSQFCVASNRIIFTKNFVKSAPNQNCLTQSAGHCWEKHLCLLFFNFLVVRKDQANRKLLSNVVLIFSGLDSICPLHSFSPHSNPVLEQSNSAQA